MSILEDTSRILEHSEDALFLSNDANCLVDYMIDSDANVKVEFLSSPASLIVSKPLQPVPQANSHMLGSFGVDSIAQNPAE